MSPYTALIGFSAWLTSRNDTLTLGSHHDASTIVELIQKWCEIQGIDMDDFNDHDLKPADGSD